MTHDSDEPTREIPMEKQLAHLRERLAAHEDFFGVPDAQRDVVAVREHLSARIADRLGSSDPVRVQDSRRNAIIERVREQSSIPGASSDPVLEQIELLTRGFAESATEAVAHGAERPMPLAVLVDHLTASAQQYIDQLARLRVDEKTWREVRPDEPTTGC